MIRLLPARQLARRMLSPVGQPHNLQDMVKLLSVITYLLSVEQKRKHNIFLYIQVRDEIIELKHESYLLPSYPAHLCVIEAAYICAVYIYRTVRRRIKTGAIPYRELGRCKQCFRLTQSRAK